MAQTKTQLIEGTANTLFVGTSGQVGIGTSTASNVTGTLLTINRASAAYTQYNQGTSGGCLVGTEGANVVFYTYTGNIGSESTSLRARLDGSGNLQFNSGYGSVATAYGCRAWVTFRDSSGTPTIAEDGNVSTIGDNGTGDYTINFSTAMPDTNYCVVGTLGADGTSFGGSALGGYMLKAFNTGSIRVLAGYGTSLIANDWQHNCIAVFR